MMSRHLLSLLALSALAAPLAAHAKPRGDRALVEEGRGPAPSIVAPGTRGMFATFSLAPAFGLSANSATQLKLGQAFGFHFSGDAEGFAIGGELQESFAGGAFALAVGPKAWFDFAVSRDYGVYIAPTVMMGLGYVSVDGYYGFGSSSAAGFDMQFGVEAKVVLADRGLLFVRPVTIDLAIGSQVAVRYDLVFGGGVTF